MPSKVFVGGLPEGTGRDQLKDLFGSFGELDDINVVRNYAFINFKNERDASKAVEELDNSLYKGKRINVEISKNKGREQGDRSKERSSSRRRSRSPQGRSRGGQSSGLGVMLSNPLGALTGGLGILGSNPQAQLPSITNQPNWDKTQHQSRQTNSNRPNPDVRVRKEVVHVSHVPQAASMGITDGYVVYERYYVDPNHPLLREPRLEDASVYREPRIEDAPVVSRVEDSAVYSGSRSNESFPAPRGAHAYEPLPSPVKDENAYDKFYNATPQNSSSRRMSPVTRRISPPPKRHHQSPPKRSYSPPRKQEVNYGYDPLPSDNKSKNIHQGQQNWYLNMNGQQQQPQQRNDSAPRQQQPPSWKQQEKRSQQNQHHDNKQHYSNSMLQQQRYQDSAAGGSDPYAALSERGAQVQNYGNFSGTTLVKNNRGYTVSYN